MISSVFVIAKNEESDIKSPILTDFKLEVFREGELSPKMMVVWLETWKVEDNFHVFWTHVDIVPSRDNKEVGSRARHFSTLEGTIENVKVMRNRLSFRLEHLSGLGLTADVVMKKRDGHSGYSVEASVLDVALEGSEIVKFPERWKSTDKQFVLLYKEVP